MTGIAFLTLLGAGCLRSRSWHSWFLLWAMREGFVPDRSTWLVNGHLLIVFPLCVCVSVQISSSQVLLVLTSGSSATWFPCHFDMSLFYGLKTLSVSLLSGMMRYSRLILHMSSPRINHFSKEPCFLLLKNSIRNHDLGPRYAGCYWHVIAARLCQLEK